MAPTHRSPEEVAIRRNAILNQSDFFKSMQRLRRTIERLRHDLEEFSQYSADDLIEDWFRAGLPLPDSDADGPYAAHTQGMLELMDQVPRETAGFLWCVDGFLAVLYANCMEERRSRRNGRNK